MSNKSKKEIPLLDNNPGKMEKEFKFLSNDNLESFTLAKAIKEGESGKLIDTNLFLKSLAL